MSHSEQIVFGGVRVLMFGWPPVRWSLFRWPLAAVAPGSVHALGERAGLVLSMHPSSELYRAVVRQVEYFLFICFFLVVKTEQRNPARLV